MPIQIGRFGIDVAENEVDSWTDSDGGFRLSGFTTGTVAEADVLRQQLLGYVDLPDEEFVPIIWAERPTVDGFYRLTGATVRAVRGFADQGEIEFTVSGQRVQDSAAPVVELVVSGGSRSAESQVITNEFKNPFFDGAAAPVTETSTSAVGILSDGGNNVGYFTASGTGFAGARMMPNADRPAAASGETWWQVVSVKNPNGSSRNVQVVLRFYDTFGATTGSTTASVASSSTAIAAGATTVFSLSGTAPASTASVAAIVFRVSGSNGDQIYADSVYLGKSDPTLLDVTPTVFSGATSNVYPATHAWTGTTNASASTRTLALIALNGRIGIPEDAVSLATIDRDNTVTSPTILSVALETGTVRRFDTPADSFRAQFTLPADSFYDGSATLEAGDPLAVVTGRQVGNTPDDWLLSNGCFEIRPVAGVAMAFEMREWFSSAWGDWQTVTLNAQRDPAFSGNILNPHTFTVLRNSPECVTIRLSAKHSYTTGAFFNEAPVTVDISLRRGARAVSIEMKTAVIAYMTVTVEGFSAASPVNHGWYLASSRAFIRSPQVLNAVSGSPSLVRTPSTATRLSVGVGFSVTPAASKPAGTEFEYDYYIWAGSERQRVVAR